MELDGLIDLRVSANIASVTLKLWLESRSFR